MKKRLKFLFIVFIQLIFLSNVFAIENGKEYTLTHSDSISSTLGFEDYQKHTASDGNKTYNAYLLLGLYQSYLHLDLLNFYKNQT